MAKADLKTNRSQLNMWYERIAEENKFKGMKVIAILP